MWVFNPSLRVQKPEVDEKQSFHSKPVLQSHLELLRADAFSDVAFIVGPEEERIPCHQLFLKARSPVFQVMFSERWSQDSNKEVSLQDVDPNIFKKFLQYVYADTLEATPVDALALLQVADKYDVQLLVTKCKKLLERELTLDDVVDVFKAARKYDQIELLDKVGDFMAMSLPKFQSHPSFSRVDKQFLMFILNRNDLNMKEVDVFRLALTWANNQTGCPVDQSLEDILPLIRFPTMTSNELTTVVLPTGLLSQSQLIELFKYFGADAQTKKSLANTLAFSTEQRTWTHSVALYSRDFDDCKIVRERYRELSDRLECDIYNLNGAYGMFSTLYAMFSSQPKPKSVALFSITLYCPMVLTKCSSNWETDSNVTKTFKIKVAAKHYLDKDFKNVLVLPEIKAQEGKLTEVEFAVPVPLDSQRRYSINVKEIESTESLTLRERYAVRDFGSIHRHVTTALGESWAYVRNISNSRGYSDTSEYCYSAQLIYKLGLKEEK